jgi:hypothetical protein
VTKYNYIHEKVRSRLNDPVSIVDIQHWQYYWLLIQDQGNLLPCKDMKTNDTGHAVNKI